LQRADLSTSWFVIQGFSVGLVIPDLWQQEAVRALQQGKDVVVQAPTGSGKTHIFELLYPSLKKQAVFTVPTRALANDKLAEWRASGWDVGISTGDVAIHLDARVVVATLETQRGRFLRGEGPGLLVLDEFQMLGDELRGVHYELAVALAPKHTQLLFLSGSVANPQDVVAWLQRIGRDAVLIEHRERPVPLEEADLLGMPDSQFVQSRNFWALMVGRASRAELSPVLIFAPRRAAAEQIAKAIASAVPVREPLRLTPAQEGAAGRELTKLLRSRVAYHHSGLSYAARAGVVEALAKSGQLNVVVATMGLAAGINFSMRSVIVTDRRYFAGNFERQVEADELLQMFGRAGRRGLDEIGYALYTNDLPRLSDARPRQLKRAAQVDWPSLISVMHAAAERGEKSEVGGQNSEIRSRKSELTDQRFENPFAAAVDLTRSLFSVQQVPLGVEHSLETGPRPCGWWVTDERARFVRRGVTEMLNSHDEWEPKPPAENVTLGVALVRENPEGIRGWRNALTVPRMLEGIGTGNLCRLRSPNRYGRELPVATVLPSGDLVLVKWLKKAMRGKEENAQRSTSNVQRPTKHPTIARRVFSQGKFEAEMLPLLFELVRPGIIVDHVTRGRTVTIRIDYSNVSIQAHIDSSGKALVDPLERENLPEVCRSCDQLEHDKSVTIVNSPAYAWRHLGLVEANGTPTTRGIIFSFFHGGEGLAIAAALEDEAYPIGDLVFDIANIRAGPRFSGEDAPMGGRLGILCQRVYRRADYPGYIAMGVPVQYGAGASEVVRELVADPRSKHKLIGDLLRHGDIERALVEWRSLLHRILTAPPYPLPRWNELKKAAAELIEKTVSPTIVDLAGLLPVQQRRVS
jgi:superfamily II DNA/RNA helicase